MNKNDHDIAQRLLGLIPEENEDINIENSQDIKPHSKKNIIPPSEIAHPELLQSFMENIGDEEKILRDVKDIEEYHRENPVETGLREVKSHGLRALEGLGGSVGGLLNLLSGEAYFDDSGQLLKTDVPMLPSTSELREFTKEKTGKKYEPKSEFAKKSQEYAEDVGAALPFPGGWFQKLMIPAGGVATKELFKHQGASEKTAEFAKAGFLTLATIAHIGNAPRAARQAYNTAVNMIPQGTRMATRGIQARINNLRNMPWFRTGRTTAKGPAMDELTRIEDAIQHGSMDVHDAMQIRRDINEARKKLGSFLYEPGIDKAAARRHLDQVDNILREGLEDFGRTNNPDWLHAYERANEAYGITQRSLQLQDYIQSNAVSKHLQSNTAKLLFHLGGASVITHAPALLGAAVPISAAAKGIQVMNRMIRNPLLRNYYLQVLTEAGARNAGAMNKALIKFDKEAKKLEEKKNQKSL